MSGHTQGVWIARPDPNGGPDDACVGLHDDVSPIDLVAVCHKRDACLIAAAPELLEALNRVIGTVEHMYHTNPDPDGSLWRDVLACRAAIAKATGGQS